MTVAACHSSSVPDAAMSLGISNGTTLAVTIVVNGTEIETVAAGQADDIRAARLPALPWHVEARSPSGRILLPLNVRSGDAHQTANSSSGVAARLDLSCGRLDLWSGPPIMGPAPGPGTLGDCDP